MSEVRGCAHIEAVIARIEEEAVWLSCADPVESLVFTCERCTELDCDGTVILMTYDTRGPL